jgi:hypothetical protein
VDILIMKILLVVMLYLLQVFSKIHERFQIAVLIWTEYWGQTCMCYEFSIPFYSCWHNNVNVRKCPSLLFLTVLKIRNWGMLKTQNIYMITTCTTDFISKSNLRNFQFINHEKLYIVKTVYFYLVFLCLIYLSTHRSVKLSSKV